MSKETELLRMLSPVVRPIDMPGAVGKPTLPIESESFDALLELAHQMNATEAVQEPESDELAVDEVTGPARSGLLGRLGSLDQVANGSLRDLLADGGVEVGLT